MKQVRFQKKIAFFLLILAAGLGFGAAYYARQVQQERIENQEKQELQSRLQQGYEQGKSFLQNKEGRLSAEEYALLGAAAVAEENYEQALLCYQTAMLLSKGNNKKWAKELMEKLPEKEAITIALARWLWQQAESEVAAEAVISYYRSLGAEQAEKEYLQTVLAGGENSGWRERFAELEEKERKAEQAKREEEERLRQEKEKKEKLRQKEIERLSPRAEKDAKLHRSLTELSARGYTMTTAFNQHITFDSGNTYRVEYRIYSKEVIVRWEDQDQKQKKWANMRHYIVFWDEDGYLTSVHCVFEQEERPEYYWDSGGKWIVGGSIEYYPMKQGEIAIDKWIDVWVDEVKTLKGTKTAEASYCFLVENGIYGMDTEGGRARRLKAYGIEENEVREYFWSDAIEWPAD